MNDSNDLAGAQFAAASHLKTVQMQEAIIAGRTAYDATAVMAVTALMVDLARTIDATGTTVMISQAAAVLEALAVLPVVDSSVHVTLTQVLRGELDAKEAECANMARKLNEATVAPVAGSEDDLLEVARGLCSIAARRADLPDSKREHYPHADEEGAPILIAARAACVARGYTEDGLAIEGIAYALAAAPRQEAQPAVQQLTEAEILESLNTLSHEPPKRLPPGWINFARSIERKVQAKFTAPFQQPAAEVTK